MRNFSRAMALLFVGALAIGGQACGGSDSGNSGGSGGGGKGGSAGGGGSSSGGGGGSSSSGGGGGSSSSGGGGGSASGGGGGSSSGAVTYDKDAKPIFAAKCSPCHTSTGSAKFFHTLASVYTTATKDSTVCTGKKKGECTIVRIKSGEMPQGAGCTGKPAMDSANDKCLTQAQQDTLQAWIDGGMLEK